MCPREPISTILHRGGPVPSKGRILHVEDNADNRHLVRRVLEAEGYEVIEAANGAQALAFLESIPVDLALLDINMPDIDGYTLATRIRSSPKFARLPILAMTANVMRGDRDPPRPQPRAPQTQHPQGCGRAGRGRQRLKLRARGPHARLSGHPL